MATLTPTQPQFVRSAHPDTVFKGDPNTTVYTETAGQSWTAGALIYQTAGKFSICTASTRIFGQAMNKASGVTAAPISNIRVIRPGDVFKMNLYSSTPGNALVALTQIGLEYGIRVVSGVFVVDVDVTALDAATPLPGVKIVDILDADLASQDTYGYVLCTFRPGSNNTSDVYTPWLQGW